MVDIAARDVQYQAEIGGWDAFSGAIIDSGKSSLDEWFGVVNDVAYRGVVSGVDTLFQTQSADAPLVRKGTEAGLINLDTPHNVLGLTFTTKTALFTLVGLIAIGYIANKVF